MTDARISIAKIIDPDAKWGEVITAGSDDDNQILLALEKADAIRALAATPAEAELREQLHYMTGTCELAMKHRDIAEAKLAAQPAVGGHTHRSELDDASNACLELCAKHGFATGHGDTVADMIREIDGQIAAPAVGGEPVAWRYRWSAPADDLWETVSDQNMCPTNRDGWHIEPLYTAQPASLLILARCDELHDLGFAAGWDAAKEACANYLSSTSESKRFAVELMTVQSLQRPAQSSSLRENADRAHDALYGLTPASPLRGREIQEACAQLADDAANADMEYAIKYPDEAHKFHQRAHRARTIASAIRTYASPTEQPAALREIRSIGELSSEARKRYPQTNGTHREAFIEGARWVQSLPTSSPGQPAAAPTGRETEMLAALQAAEVAHQALINHAAFENY